MSAANPATERQIRVAYFVHDLTDTAVHKRVRMLRAAGARVTLLGFLREGRKLRPLEDVETIDLGRTYDGRLAQRALSVLKHRLAPRTILRQTRGVDIVIGRNLEALALAARVHRANPESVLVYECLDLHSVLLRGGLANRLVQKIEQWLLRRVEHIWVSSPAFIREYFAKRGSAAQRHLIENKVLCLEHEPPRPSPPPPGPPWTIGWFGMLRCRKTVGLLRDLVQGSQGRIRILIAGRPTPLVFDDFDSEIAGVPGMDYIGAFSPDDLPALYARCHFSWCIDFYEEGLNSSWLLPNRLYESLSHGAVPIALSTVEVGRWLASHDVGVRLDTADEIGPLLSALDAHGYGALQDGVSRVPRSALIADQSDCSALLNIVRR